MWTSTLIGYLMVTITFCNNVTNVTEVTQNPLSFLEKLTTVPGEEIIFIPLPTGAQAQNNSTQLSSPTEIVTTVLAIVANDTNTDGKVVRKLLLRREKASLRQYKKKEAVDSLYYVEYIDGEELNGVAMYNLNDVAEFLKGYLKDIKICFEVCELNTV